MRHLLATACCLMLSASVGAETAGTSSTFTLKADDATGQLNAALDDSSIFLYNYGEEWNLPHFYPFNTPSGKNLLVQITEPYPHHRAFWVSDTVMRDGVKGDIYNGYYSGVKTGKKTFGPPFNTAVRHMSFDLTTSTPGMAAIKEHLVWETQRTTSTYPLLDEHRDIKLVALAGGDYLVDFSFRLEAKYGDVKFISDPVHYSWPYLRLNSTFSGTDGGVITTDSGATGQEATNLKPALWIDYSNTVDGETEGVAMFQWPYKVDEPRKWLTRDYGTFGPRRPDSQSGKPFTLKHGDSLAQRVGVFVHRGDVKTGNIGEVYQQFVDEKLSR